jgi:lipoate-protein ligase A
MLCIQSEHKDPFINLAAEEHILRNYSEDCFLMYVNEPSVIIGKHQIAYAEINPEFVRRKKIKVARRISGGGAVYHDEGNLNYTFIVNGNKGNLVNFRKFTAPVIEFLRHYGVIAKFEGRNDLMVHGRKISGNAEHIWKNKTLHHGTLLYSSNLSELSDALKPGPGKYTGKAVPSIRSSVVNIADYIPERMNIHEFRSRFLEYIMNNFPGSQVFRFPADDVSEIEKLKDDKYNRWDWNFGYSPAYIFENTLITGRGMIGLNIAVEKGIIQSFRISGESFWPDEIELVNRTFSGLRHERQSLEETISTLDFDHFFSGITPEDFLSNLF